MESAQTSFGIHWTEVRKWIAVQHMIFRMILKVYKRETFVGSDFEFCTFLRIQYVYCFSIEVLRKIIQFGHYPIRYNLSALTEAVSTHGIEFILYSVRICFVKLPS
jgi:hypothetical protein